MTEHTAVALRIESDLTDAKEQLRLLRSFVKDQMVEGTDYGVIPGTERPTLLKPGAEKLCEIYRLSIQIPESRIRRWEILEPPFFSYEVVVQLVSLRTGQVVSEGIGAANSRERRYKNQEPFSMVNTLLKMAEKRALVDATLHATRSSGVFTQDLDDVPELVQNQAPAVDMSRGEPPDRATDSQLGLIKTIGRQIGRDAVQLNALAVSLAGIGATVQTLTRRQASQLIDSLQAERDAKRVAGGSK